MYSMTKTDQKVFIAVALIVGFLTGFIAGKSTYANDVKKIVENVSGQASVTDTNAPSEEEMLQKQIALVKQKYEGLKMFNGTPTETPYLGEANAPITMTEYSDFQCPFCVSFFRKTLPAISENYIKTGKVKFEYKDFPISKHIHAANAAVAAHCAGDQEAYWYMHDLIFENQTQWAKTDAETGKKIFLSYAKALGLDEEKFTTCQEGDSYHAEIQADFNEGVKLGIDGTPGFNIEGEVVIGAEKYAAFDQIFKTKLATVK